ncbi:MAG: hypothetical protein IH914_02155 [candidate division Zixibacteria bacterium]|nr:hypothetical protein [candidate division Zixibacteria bacterium]
MGPAYLPRKVTPVFGAPVLFGFCLVASFVLGSCGNSNDPVSPLIPSLISSSPRSGQYTWIDRTDPVNPVTQFQFSSIRFFENQSGELKFTLRVDLSVANPVQRFNDLTADFTQSGDSVFIINPIIIQQGHSNNVPLGGFQLFPAVDSLILNRDSPVDSRDTTMRISIFVGGG